MWKPHEKCIKISTIESSFGLVILEIRFLKTERVFNKSDLYVIKKNAYTFFQRNFHS